MMTYESLNPFRASRQSVALIFLGAVLASAQEIPDRPVATFEAPSGSEFQEACRKLDIPGVQEAGANNKLAVKRGERLAMRNSTAKKILNEAIRRHPGFQWKFEKGLISMRPDSSKTSATEDELGRKIASLSLKDTPSNIAISKVLQAANIAIVGSHFGTVQKFRVISIDLKDVSVRDAISEIARMEGQAVWSIRQVAPNTWALNSFSWRKSGGRVEMGNDGKPHKDESGSK